jgi:predicted acyltransferase (DUF342 family)
MVEIKTGMTHSDFVTVKLPSPLLDALHHRMTATGQTETEVLLTALNVYLNAEKLEIKTQNSLSLDEVSTKQELAIVRQEIAVMKQRLAMVEQALHSLPTSTSLEAQPVSNYKGIPTVHGTVNDRSADVETQSGISEAIAQIKPPAIRSISLEAIDDDDTEDEPDEILYGFLDPEDR